jgi:hypothetical protein
MTTRRLRIALFTLAIAAVASPASAVAGHDTSTVQIKKFANCTAMNRVYAHGVGKRGAVDHVSTGGQRVRNFFVNDALYAKNSGSDRDKDGIACEQR